MPIGYGYHPQQDHSGRKVASELGICSNMLRSWLKVTGTPSLGQADWQNRKTKRVREQEAEVRSLRKKLSDKDAAIEILKNPQAYSRNHGGQVLALLGQFGSSVWKSYAGIYKDSTIKRQG